MSAQTPHDPSFGAVHGRVEQARPVMRSAYRIMPDVPKPARNTFIFGRSASRIRPLLNQEERDRLHCWAMIVAMASSAAGTALLLAAALP